MRAYVYRHFDAEGRLLYVGYTAYPALRQAQHTRSPWAGRVVSVTMQEYASSEDALLAESVAILLEKPEINKKVSRQRVANSMRVSVRTVMKKKHKQFIGPLRHPFFEWMKSNGYIMAFVARKLGVKPGQMSKYLRSGSAPLLFQNAAKGFTGGAVGYEAWELAE